MAPFSVLPLRTPGDSLPTHTGDRRGAGLASHSGWLAPSFGTRDRGAHRCNQRATLPATPAAWPEGAFDQRVGGLGLDATEHGLDGRPPAPTPRAGPARPRSGRWAARHGFAHTRGGPAPARRTQATQRSTPPWPRR